MATNMGGFGSGAATGADIDLSTGQGTADYAGVDTGLPSDTQDDSLTQGSGYVAPAGGAATGSGGGSSGGGLGGTFRDQAASLKSQATERVRAAADDGKAQVADTLDGLVTAARELADKLQGGQYGPVGSYAQSAADTLDGWARTVRDKPVDEWLDDGRELVRRSPALAAGIAVAAGFVLSRFMKASSGGTPARYNY